MRGSVVAARNHNVSNNKPVFDVRVFAATCLYTALRHLDHWPVPLVRAYAEDCFGPRLWVDHPQCAALVSNLALVASHPQRGDDGETAAANGAAAAEPSGDAALVAQAYAKFEAEVDSDMDVDESLGSILVTNDGVGGKPTASAASGSKRHRSLTSSGSFESSDASKNGVNRKRKFRNGGKSGSGGEDTNEEANSDAARQTTSDNSTSKQDDGGSSSSGEEDEDAIVMTKSEEDSSLPRKKTSSKRKSASTDTNALYPLSPEHFNFSRVRQRFFGKNLEAAHEAIISTLTDRVDLKSKQNSNLLQCLPSFTSIPGVRCQIAANLEKWLQSPALAGLARTLFTSTVNNMKNTDPPLKEDLQAIGSIMTMRLKANQVCFTTL